MRLVEFKRLVGESGSECGVLLTISVQTVDPEGQRWRYGKILYLGAAVLDPVLSPTPYTHSGKANCPADSFARGSTRSEVPPHNTTRVTSSTPIPATNCARTVLGLNAALFYPPPLGLQYNLYTPVHILLP